MGSAKAGFPPSRRLTTSSEFARVFAEADRSSDRLFTALARPAEGPIARLGLTVSRRAAKKAVDRNRLKRIAREAFRQLELEALDFVIIAKRDAATADGVAIRRSLEQHFRRLSDRAHERRDG